MTENLVPDICAPCAGSARLRKCAKLAFFGDFNCCVAFGGASCPPERRYWYCFSEINLYWRLISKIDYPTLAKRPCFLVFRVSRYIFRVNSGFFDGMTHMRLFMDGMMHFT